MLGARVQAVRQVLAGDDEILAKLILAANDHMTVRMAGVEVVDGDPVEPGSKVSFGLPHPAANERLQVLVFGAVLRGDDEAELVTIALPCFEECLAIHVIAVRPVELAAASGASGAIALQVSEVRKRGRPSSPELHYSRLDDCPAMEAQTALPTRSKQPADAGTAADAHAGEAPRAAPDVAAGAVDRAAHPMRERPVAADAAEPQVEGIVGHGWDLA